VAKTAPVGRRLGRREPGQPSADELITIERALEQLFRLNASRKVHSRRAAAAGVAISQPGFQLLRRIQESEHGLQIGELARMCDMDPAATGRQIALLEQDGLVSRERDSEDARAVIVRVTPKGADARQRLGVVMGRHMADVLSDWSATDRQRLAVLLPRLVDGLRTVAYRGAWGDHEEGQVRSA